MAIADSIQANFGPLLCFLKDNFLQLMFIYLLCHLHELTDTLVLLFGVSTVFEIYNGGILCHPISK